MTDIEAMPLEPLRYSNVIIFSALLFQRMILCSMLKVIIQFPFSIVSHSSLSVVFYQFGLNAE